MARPAKLTAEEWQKIRDAWANDPRKGFVWLRDEFNLDMTDQALRNKAKRDGWQKFVCVEEEKNNKPTNKIQTNKQKGAGTVRKPKKSLITKTVAENEELSENEKVFVAEYLKSFNATEAARVAGFGVKACGQRGWQMLQKPSIQNAIKKSVAARVNRIGIDGDDLMRLWADTVNYDANEMVQIRRIPCPYCYSKDDQPQYTVKSYQKAKKAHDSMRLRRLSADPEDDIGEFPAMNQLDFIDPHKPANPDCPVCHGDGQEEYFPMDTRFLSETGKRMYCGASKVMGEVQYAILSKEKAADNLAKALGLFKDKEEEKSAVTVDAERLFAMFEERMEKSRERQRQALVNRGMTDVTDIEPNDD